jgi:hypothetical protein
VARLQNDTQHNDTQHEKTMLMLILSVVMLNVVMLSVVARIRPFEFCMNFLILVQNDLAY